MLNAHAQFPGESTLLLSVMEELAEVRTKEEFIRCTQKSFQYVLPHEVMCGSIGMLNANGSPRPLDFLSHNFPIDFIVDTHGPNGEIAATFFDFWFATEEPQLWEPEHNPERVSKRWLTAFVKHDLRNLVSYGIKGRPQNEPSTYFVFSRVKGPLGPRHARVMRLLGPHIHIALTRVFAQAVKEGGGELVEGLINERQREILHCIRQGKTNREIERALGLTEKAVKYHIGKILEKLDVSNRTQAVAKATAMKLIR